MGHKDRRETARALGFPYQIHQLPPESRIESGEGLIEQQEPRAHQKAAGQRHAALLSAREFVRKALFQSRKSEGGKQFRDLRARFLTRVTKAIVTCTRQANLQISVDRERRKQAMLLKHHAELSLFDRALVHTLAVKADFARRERQKARNRAEQTGLSRARGPE